MDFFLNISSLMIFITFIISVTIGFKVHYANKEEQTTMQFMDRDYKLLDPTKFMFETFTMPVYPQSHHEFTLGIIVGTMSIGKSNTIRYFADIANRIYGNFLIRNQDTGKLERQSMLNAMYVKDIGMGIEACIKNPKYVQFLAIDDAVTSGMDARRSMSGANVSLSQRFYMIRHELEDAYPAGYEIIILGTQDYEAIDKRIRKNAQFTIFKNYYEEVEYLLNFEMEYIEFLKEVTDEALRKHNFKARAFGVGFTQIGDLVKLYIPQVHPSEVPFIKKISVEERKMTLRKQLMEEIINNGVLEGGQGAGHGFILRRLREVDKARYIQFSSSERTDILYEAKYLITSGNYTLYKIKEALKVELQEELIKTQICIEKESMINAFIRKFLKSKDIDPSFFNKKELRILVEDAKYEYFDTHNKGEEVENGYAMDPSKLTIPQAITKFLELKGIGMPKEISDGIGRPSGSVTAELSRNDLFVRIGFGTYALKNSIYHKKMIEKQSIDS